MLGKSARPGMDMFIWQPNGKFIRVSYAAICMAATPNIVPRQYRGFQFQTNGFHGSEVY